MNSASTALTAALALALVAGPSAAQGAPGPVAPVPTAALFAGSTTLAPALGTAPTTQDLTGGADDRRWYVKLFLGQGLLADADLDRSAGTPSGDGDASFDSGLFTGAALGYRFDDRWSLELDYTYRSNDVDEVSFGGSLAATDGDYASTTIGLTALYRFAPGERLRPYVGAGLSWVTEIDVDLGSGASEESFSDSGLGAQLVAGVEWSLTDALGLYAEARWFRAFSHGMTPEVSTTPGRIDGDYSHLGLALGVVWAF